MCLNQQTADDLISKAVRTAIREYSKEQKIIRRNRALHNTKMLLKNYEKIKSSVEGAISEANQLEQDSFDCTDNEEVYINSIRRSKLKSLIVITHIENALDTIKNQYKTKGTPEKYEAFVSCFMQNMNYDDAAKQYLSSKTSIGRWINEITKEISIQLFGIEGITLV